ncbi:hypothetical protein O9992_09720 [Vibrio lentus]|nr:hypothetical protein [Vibrio lentus]
MQTAHRCSAGINPHTNQETLEGMMQEAGLKILNTSTLTTACCCAAPRLQFLVPNLVAGSLSVLKKIRIKIERIG